VSEVIEPRWIGTREHLPAVGQRVMVLLSNKKETRQAELEPWRVNDWCPTVLRWVEHAGCGTTIEPLMVIGWWPIPEVPDK